MIIRPELPTESSQIFRLIQNAFKDEKMSDHTEGYLVDRLRKSENFIPSLSFVAELNGMLVGYLLLTPISIRTLDSSFPILALAPIAVLPSHQKQGIGSSLIRHAHTQALEHGFNSIVLIGHSDYYPKFGYKSAENFGIRFPFLVPKENAFVAELEENSLQGISGLVTYSDEFLIGS